MMEKHFQESDIGTAAFLSAKGFRLLDLVAEGGRRYSFIFDDSGGDAASAAREYRQGAQVTAREIIAAQKNLKWILYEKKGMNNGTSGRSGGGGRC